MILFYDSGIPFIYIEHFLLHKQFYKDDDRKIRMILNSYHRKTINVDLKSLQ